MSRILTIHSSKETPAEAALEIVAELDALPNKNIAGIFVFVSGTKEETIEEAFASFANVIFWYGQRALSSFATQISAMVFNDCSFHTQLSEPEEMGALLAANLMADAPIGDLRFLSLPDAFDDRANCLNTLDEGKTLLFGGTSTGATHASLVGINGFRSVSLLLDTRFEIGPVRTITDAKENILHSLDSKSALKLAQHDLGETTHGALYALIENEMSSSMHRVTRALNDGALLFDSPLPTQGSLVFLQASENDARHELEAALLETKDALKNVEVSGIVVFSSDQRQRILQPAYVEIERIADRFSGVPVAGITTKHQFAAIDDTKTKSVDLSTLIVFLLAH